MANSTSPQCHVAEEQGHRLPMGPCLPGEKGRPAVLPVRPEYSSETAESLGSTYFKISKNRLAEKLARVFLERSQTGCMDVVAVHTQPTRRLSGPA
jgi:hypothetical protein